MGSAILTAAPPNGSRLRGRPGRSLALEVDSRLRVSGLPCQEEEREVELAGVCERAENAYRDAVVAGLPDDVVGTLFEIADERRQNCWIADANEHGRRLRGGHAASPLPGHLFLSSACYNPRPGGSLSR